MSPRWSWALAAAALAAVGLDTFATLVSRSELASATVHNHGWPMIPLAGLGSAALGALVLSRRPRHPLGVLLALAGLLTTWSSAGDAYGIWVLEAGGPGPDAAGSAAGWLSLLLSAAALPCLALIFLLAPDGRLPSRRWWAAVVLVVVGDALLVLPIFLEPQSFGAAGADLRHPLSLLSARVGPPLFAAGLLLCAVSLLVRSRRARSAARAQLRWIVLAAWFLAGSFGFLVGVQATTEGEGYDVVSVVPLYCALLALPVAVSIAVLRHRLFDVDVIVSRAGLMIGTALFVTLAYVLLVSALGQTLTGFWPSVLGTAAVALAFQPFRRRLGRLADRLAYGDQARPHLALAELSRRLGRTAEPDQLLPLVAGAVAQAFAATYVQVGYAPPGGRPETVRWPPGAPGPPPELAVEVSYAGAVLGAIAVQPAPGRALRRRDLSVLQALAAQVGVAFHYRRLDEALAERVTSLGVVADQLEVSQVRLREVRDEQVGALRARIGRDVVPRLRSLAGRLEAAERGVRPQPAWAEWQDEVARTVSTVRAISRGLGPEPPPTR